MEVSGKLQASTALFRGRSPSTNRIGGWAQASVCLGAVENRKISSRYVHWAIPATIIESVGGVNIYKLGMN